MSKASEYAEKVRLLTDALIRLSKKTSRRETIEFLEMVTETMKEDDKSF